MTLKDTAERLNMTTAELKNMEQAKSSPFFSISCYFISTILASCYSFILLFFYFYFYDLASYSIRSKPLLQIQCTCEPLSMMNIKKVLFSPSRNFTTPIS